MRCERCGGLKVRDHFYGTLGGLSAWAYDGLRCVNCGHVSEFAGGRPISGRPATAATVGGR